MSMIPRRLAGWKAGEAVSDKTEGPSSVKEPFRFQCACRNEWLRGRRWWQQVWLMGWSHFLRCWVWRWGSGILRRALSKIYHISDRKSSTCTHHSKRKSRPRIWCTRVHWPHATWAVEWTVDHRPLIHQSFQSVLHLRHHTPLSQFHNFHLFNPEKSGCKTSDLG